MTANQNKNALINCQEMEVLMYAYLDEQLNGEETASFLEHLASCQRCEAHFSALQRQESELRSLLGAPIAPPADFCDRVMANLNQATAPVVKVLPNRAKVVRRWGTLAAAAVLVIGVAAYGLGSGDNTGMQVAHNPEADTIHEPLQVEQPVVSKELPPVPSPVNVAANQPLPQPPTAPVVKKPVAQLPAQPPKAPDTNEPNNLSNGTLTMPRASFGTDTVGSFSTRLLASFDNTNLYAPKISDNGKSISFYTNLEDEIQLWSARLDKSSEPTCLGTGDELDTVKVLAASCPISPVNTTIFSPDNTMFASNNRGEEPGVWISSKDSTDKPYLLCDAGGGNLLAWAPNSNKLAFTDTAGNLYVGYAIEQRAFKLVDGQVTDLVWSADSQALVYVVKNADSTYNSLCTVQVP